MYMCIYIYIHMCIHTCLHCSTAPRLRERCVKRMAAKSTKGRRWASTTTTQWRRCRGVVETFKARDCSMRFLDVVSKKSGRKQWGWDGGYYWLIWLMVSKCVCIYEYIYIYTAMQRFPTNWQFLSWSCVNDGTATILQECSGNMTNEIRYGCVWKVRIVCFFQHSAWFSQEKRVT